MTELTVTTSEHCQFVNIDRSVQRVIEEAGVTNGICVIFVPHTTAGITINENADPDVVSDMKMILDRIVPWEGGYDHAEGNSAAHVKASMMGNSVHVIVRNGHLQFGTWQSIHFCEFDGPRTRKVWVQIIPA
ncbi:MAG: YjbQ family protein [Candidatus Hydrogenedentes bacterium]|nr:YjbQ family protein [Candidatus Hydrogenedentota bacterium]